MHDHLLYKLRFSEAALEGFLQLTNGVKKSYRAARGNGLPQNVVEGSPSVVWAVEGSDVALKPLGPKRGCYHVVFGILKIHKFYVYLLRLQERPKALQSASKTPPKHFKRIISVACGPSAGQSVCGVEHEAWPNMKPNNNISKTTRKLI